ncbi:MAG: GNAT family protein [Armatimonadota bacterium]|nr:GNAT family protein [Armatimonadota bacterium]MDR7486673.1 GNAT family protein [Armatimonadota bacterium]MDR7534673.1 GNAT family protein [Armatimonadota bacterium]MDR7535074.1 GNAT family protein [Armatimonadota bacterium]
MLEGAPDEVRTVPRVEEVFGDLPVLETPRLLLRPLTLEDAADIYAYASDPEVSRYVTWHAHRSIEDTRTFLHGALALYAAGQVAPWGMVHRADGKVIGTCGFVSWYPDHGRAEIGYSLARAYWRQGYTTEAVRRIMRFGFEVMALNRIEARCEIPNVASARLLEKVGMTFEGILREHVYGKGRYRDMQMYSILRREWHP